MSGNDEPDLAVDLTPHRLAPRPEADAESESGLTTIVGFVGSSSMDGGVRVYLDLSFASYYEVAATDVVRTKAVDSDDPDSPRALWIRSSAQLDLVRTDRLSGSASFVTGAIRRRFSARAAGNYVLADNVMVEAGGGTDWCYSINPHLCPPPTSGVIFHCC